MLDLTNTSLNNLKNCRKKPIVIQAVQINEPFVVDTLENQQHKGKAGDYLMIGIKGERYICDKTIFEESYDWVEDEKE